MLLLGTLLKNLTSLLCKTSSLTWLILSMGISDFSLGMPTPLGKFVTLMQYVDANLYHDLITGKSVTGILHLANKTPIDWYSKNCGNSHLWFRVHCCLHPCGSITDLQSDKIGSQCSSVPGILFHHQMTR